MLDIVVFNVEHGQSIFFYPQGKPDYSMFVDCGNTPEFEPIDEVTQLLPKDHLGRFVLGNLTLTNYDHDHFSGLSYLMSKAFITTIRFARNISTQELIVAKPERTDALDRICYLQDNYIHPAPLHIPPYTVETFSLPRHCFPDGECDTNNLSQIVFVSYGGSVVCVAGDVEADGWAQLLLNENFKTWLRSTNVFIAAHHGRKNGYAQEAFAFCGPECIIFSDKKTVVRRKGMTQLYANHVVGTGVLLSNQRSLVRRKVLTTRSDGHIFLRFSLGGVRNYRNLA